MFRGCSSVSETGFVSDSSDLPVVGSIEIDVESLRSRGVVFGCALESFCLPIMPSALMVFIFLIIAVLLLLYAFALGMRMFYAFWAWCVFPIFGGCSLVLMETSGFVLGRVQGYLGWVSFRFRMS